MILAIDVGNTNIVLGCIEEGNITNLVRMQTESGNTPEDFAIKLKQIFDYYCISPNGFEAAIMASVVPPVTGVLKEAIKTLTGLTCLVVGPGLKTGMNIRIDDPGTLAADLVVGSMAAMHFYGAPVIILDMGTATTAMVVDKNRTFIGGAIIPGVRLSYQALSAGTSLLPDISISAPRKCIATNTVDCMQSGAVYGTAAMLDGMIERMEAELGERCTVVATGGLASSIVRYCKRQDIICDDNLLLKGLWYLYQKNQ